MGIHSGTGISSKIDARGIYFIAEMSANHGNDLNVALDIVRAAAKSGADCLKVQTYTADTLTLDCNSKLFQIDDGLWKGQTLYELYSDASMPWEWHFPIMQLCNDLGLDFLSTPFDKSSVDFLCDLGVDALKIASFELVDIPLIEYASSKGKTIILSTGMASLAEIEDAVQAIRGTGNDDFILLRCCSEYPANPRDLNLSSIPDLAKRFDAKVGFSDHSMGHLADVVAASLGACVIEKHFCLSRDQETADASFSMTPCEFQEMVTAVRSAYDAFGSPLYGPSGAEEDSLRFRRSIFACRDIAEGDSFTEENIRVIRPSYGLKPKYMSRILGTKSKNSYSFGDPILEDEIR